MDASEPTLLSKTARGMDRRIEPKPWSVARWPRGMKIAVAAAAIALAAFAAIRLFAGAGVRTLRVPFEQVTVATVQRGVFQDLIPLRAVAPRETIYADATDGGRVDRVLVEPAIWSPNPSR